VSAVEGRGGFDLRGRAVFEAEGRRGKDGGDQRDEVGREDGARKGARKDWTELLRGIVRDTGSSMNGAFGSGSGLPA